MAEYTNSNRSPYKKAGEILYCNRAFAKPADILYVAADAPNHRIGMNFTARAEGVRPTQAIARILERVQVP